MWAAVEARLDTSGTPAVVPISGPSDGPREDSGPDGSRGARDALGPTRRFRGAWLALAASAVLALGVGLGRWSREAPEAAMDPVPVATRGAGGGTAPTARPHGTSVARMAAVEMLGRSEPLLATVRAEASRGAVDAEVGEWARKILGDTRFLLDSGLPLDPQLRSLLEDLELVLLQTALVGSGDSQGPRAQEELELLRQGMNDKNVLTRIQAVLPETGAGI